MGAIKPPRPAMLLVGALFSSGEPMGRAGEALRESFGRILHETEPVPWHSQHYREELGWPIMRKFLFFETLIDPCDIAGIKLKTILLESTLSEDGKRQVNLDPGYITLAKLVLASTKDFAHRVCISKGVYAEVTLTYSRKENGFIPQANTYRDFRERQNLELFTRMRQALKAKLSPLEYLEEGPE